MKGDSDKKIVLSRSLLIISVIAIVLWGRITYQVLYFTYILGFMHLFNYVHIILFCVDGILVWLLVVFIRYCIKVIKEVLHVPISKA